MRPGDRRSAKPYFFRPHKNAGQNNRHHNIARQSCNDRRVAPHQNAVPPAEAAASENFNIRRRDQAAPSPRKAGYVPGVPKERRLQNVNINTIETLPRLDPSTRQQCGRQEPISTTGRGRWKPQRPGIFSVSPGSTRSAAPLQASSRDLAGNCKDCWLNYAPLPLAEWLTKVLMYSMSQISGGDSEGSAADCNHPTTPRMAYAGSPYRRPLQERASVCALVLRRAHVSSPFLRAPKPMPYAFRVSIPIESHVIYPGISRLISTSLHVMRICAKELSLNKPYCLFVGTIEPRRTSCSFWTMACHSIRTFGKRSISFWRDAGLEERDYPASAQHAEWKRLYPLPGIMCRNPSCRDLTRRRWCGYLPLAFTKASDSRRGSYGSGHAGVEPPIALPCPRSLPARAFWSIREASVRYRVSNASC